MDYRFYLIYNGIKTEIEEPVDWDDIETTLKREKTHGIVFEIAINGLGFYGRAKQIILEAIDKEGLNANVVFLVEWRCVSYKWEHFYSGKLSVVNGFDYSDDTVSCVIENIDPVVLFNNRLDQKVDLFSSKSIGGVDIQKAEQKRVKVNGQHLGYLTRAVVPEDGWECEMYKAATEHIDISEKKRYGFILPLWEMKTSDLGSVTTSSSYESYVLNEKGTPTFCIINKMFENDKIIAKDGVFKCRYRLKGRIKGNLQTNARYHKSFIELDIDGGFKTGKNRKVIAEDFTIDFREGIEFDLSDEILIEQNPKDKVCTFFRIGFELWTLRYDTEVPEVTVIFDKESFVDYSCMTTVIDNNYSFVKSVNAIDALRGITEQITDGKMEFNSPLYRDPLLGNTMISSGKLIRSGLNTDITAPTVHSSFKDVYGAIDSIACLGVGLSQGKIVVAHFTDFYENIQALDLGEVGSIRRVIDNEKIVSSLKVGYSKFSSEGQSGAEDLFGGRDYVTTLESSKNPLDKVCKFIASGYVIEECRRVVNKADNNGYKYDEDLFLLQCKEGTLETDTANSYNGLSGVSLINSKLTPFQNAIRWGSYCSLIKMGNLADRNVLGFTAGTGNLQAIVNGTPESSHVFVENIPDYHPSTLPSVYIDRFTCPLSKEQYEKIKMSPYRYITYSGINGWINSIKYRHSKGEAEMEVFPSIGTFKSLYKVECPKITPVNEELNKEIVFVERFEEFENGLPRWWSGSLSKVLIEPIQGGGVKLSGLNYFFDSYVRTTALRYSSYIIEIEMHEVFKLDPFDGLHLLVGTRDGGEVVNHRIDPQIKYVFEYKGEIEYVGIRYFAARNADFNVKLKSITIKRVEE